VPSPKTKSTQDLDVNLARVEEFLASCANYEAVKQLSTFRDLAAQTTTLSEIQTWNPQECKYKKEKASCPSECTLWVIPQDNNPFAVKLIWVNTTFKGGPRIKVLLFNTLTNKVLDLQVANLARRKNKATRALEMQSYWESGAIQSDIAKLPVNNLIPFSNAMEQYATEKTTDLNGNTLTRTSIRSITYLYAQIRNNSHGYLSVEPCEWDMPASVTSRISSGLADALQYELENSPCTAKEHKKWSNRYPSIVDFMNVFDAHYR
jgi:hypothetical protein